MVEGGPWGPAGDVVLSLLPIAFLLLVTLVKPIALTTATSLPLAAFFLWLVRMVYFSHDPNFVNACVLYGVLDTLTPVSICFGAILLFAVMEETLCLPWIIQTIKQLSGGHPVAEVLLIGWAFVSLIEGASGFGTPVALGAPMLAALGHDPFLCVVCLLVMDTMATVFGAVGTPMWFGFDGLGLTDDELLLVGLYAAGIIGVCAFAIVPVASGILVPMREIMRSALFVALSIASVAVPLVATAAGSYEFPSLAGGLVGLAVTSVLIRFNVGLSTSENASRSRRTTALGESARAMRSSKAIIDDSGVSAWGTNFDAFDFTVSGILKQQELGLMPIPDVADGDSPLPHSTAAPRNGDGPHELADTPSEAPPSSSKIAIQADEPSAPSPNDTTNVNGKPCSKWFLIFMRTFPLASTILILIVTRAVPFIKFDILKRTEPAGEVPLYSLGTFRISACLVISLQNILLTDVTWTYETLYVPSLLPFVLVSVISMVMFREDVRSNGGTFLRPFGVALRRVFTIVTPLVGAMILVALIRRYPSGEPELAPAYLIGYHVSSWVGKGWLAFSAFFGALGSFFSGSTTVSNLTFGAVQKIAATNIGLPYAPMLALQVAGAAAGNAVCINNVLAARAVMGLTHIPEGRAYYVPSTNP